MSSEFPYDCRLLADDGSADPETWTLLLQDFGFHSKNMAKAFHPMFARLLSDIFTDGNMLPAVYTDFGQQQEMFKLVCFTPEGYNTIEMVNYISRLRYWIQHNRMKSDVEMYLQLYRHETVAGSGKYEVAMDPNGVPMMMGSNRGFRGIVTAGPEFSKFPAASGSITFTIDFGVGIVLP